MTDRSLLACARPLSRQQGASALPLPCRGSFAPASVDAPSDALLTRRTRFLTAAMAFLIAFSVVSSSFTVAGDFHHHHTGDGCTVCAEMAGCLHMARVGATLVASATVLVIVRALVCPLILGEERGRHACSTLVHLKVQLND